MLMEEAFLINQQKIMKEYPKTFERLQMVVEMITQLVACYIILISIKIMMAARDLDR